MMEIDLGEDDEYLTIVYQVKDWQGFNGHLEAIKAMTFNDKSPAAVRLMSVLKSDADKLLDEGV